MDLSLILPAFFAGILTFLAPCTLPLVPGYLGFISGASVEDLKDPAKAKHARRKIFMNGLLYVIGFTAVFVLMGTIFGIGGIALAKYRIILTRVAGVFVIIFGLYMIGILKLKFLNFLNSDKHASFTKHLKPGKPTSSLLFGGAFAFGWTPCVGPILGSVLLLASTTSTVGQGAFMLFVFSLGLAVPFLLIAAGVGTATKYLKKFTKYLSVISIIGGVFLIFIGILLVTNSFSAWFAFFYSTFDFINYDRLLDYL